MSNLSLVISRKSLVILLSACLVGILFAGPLFLIKKAVESRGLTFLASQYTAEANELEMDLPRAREVFDGHLLPSELSADDSGPTPLNPVPIWLLSVPIFLVGGNINNAYILNQFLFGAAMFLVFYFLGLTLTRKFWWAYFMGFLGALTPLARYLPRGVSGWDNFLNLVVKNFIPFVNSPLESLFLHKVVDPIITFIFYIPAIGFLIWFWRIPNKKTATWAAISIGLLFYVYWHYWVYLLAVVILLAVYSFYRRNWDLVRWQAMIRLLLILAIVALPYFINYFIFNSSDFAKEIVERYGVVEPGRWLQVHRVIPDYIFYLVSSALVYLVLWRGKIINAGHRASALLFWAFNLAAFGVWNMQLVTGFNLTANHWWLAYAPIGLLILFYLVYAVTDGKIGNKKIVHGVLAALVVLLVIKKIVNVFIFTVPSDEIIQKYSFNPAIALAWKEINKIGGEPKVISPVFMDSVYLTIHTSARPYLPFYMNTLMSDFELENRFLNSQKLFGISRENLEKQLRWRFVPSGCEAAAGHFKVRDLVCDGHTRFSFENGRFLYGFKYLPEHYSTAGKIKPRWDIPEDKIQELLKRYDALRVSWRDIDADYVYLSPMGKSLVGKSFQYENGLELQYENDGVELYRISN